MRLQSSLILGLDKLKSGFRIEEQGMHKNFIEFGFHLKMLTLLIIIFISKRYEILMQDQIEANRGGLQIFEEILWQFKGRKQAATQGDTRIESS